MTTKILVFTSNPQDTEQLQLNQEFREIERARKQSNQKNEFTVLRVPGTTVDDLQREISEEKARIVHFCGHGLGEEGLVLETELGKQQILSTQAISGLFKLFANQVECVILNACSSESQATEIHKHINYVIGTRKAIKDEAALAFSKGFYTGIFSRNSIELAYEFGKSRIQQEFYNNKNEERKLVPVDMEEGEQLEDEVFTFKIKEPPSKIAFIKPPSDKMNLKDLIKNGILNELAISFNEEDMANILLKTIDFPDQMRPIFPSKGRMLGYWQKICQQIQNGVVPSGNNLQPLVDAAADICPANSVFQKNRS